MNGQKKYEKNIKFLVFFSKTSDYFRIVCYNTKVNLIIVLLFKVNIYLNPRLRYMNLCYLLTCFEHINQLSCFFIKYAALNL